MSEVNFKNRTLMHGDNLDFLRSINTGTVDLIATDPPFNKNKDFHAAPNTSFEGTSFRDRWTWDDAKQEWTDKLEDDFPSVMNVINSTRKSYGDDMGGFLCFMGVRILEMRRVLKDSGSMYIHCDPTASHYIKMVMDSIFGKKNFRNEIIWSYRTGGSSKTCFSKKHDVILFYTKSNKYKFIPQKEKAYTKSKSRKPGIVDYGAGFAEFFDDGEGVYNLVNMRDVWEIPYINSQAKERMGSPTQKPLALYERIIKASSNEGDIVLDPFCGCATTCVAAEKLDRKWVGIDIWDEAHEMVIKNLEQQGILSTNGRKREDVLVTKGDITYRKRVLKRTDDGEEAVPYLKPRSKQVGIDPHTNQEKKKLLLERDGFICQGCGRKLHESYLELDHMMPRADGGSNLLYNRILLCGPCNRRKSSRYTLSGLRKENIKIKFMYDESGLKDFKE